MLQVNNFNNMLSASILKERNLLSVVSFIIICCTLHKLIVKKKKSVFKRNQMINCCFNHHCVYCHSHLSSLSVNYPWKNYTNYMDMTMASLLVTMRGAELSTFLFGELKGLTIKLNLNGELNSRSKCLPKLESTHSHYGVKQMYMVNQPSQTKTETIKISTLVDNQQLILNTATPTITAYKSISYSNQQDNWYGHLELNNHPNMIYSDMSEVNVFRGFLPHESVFRPETASTMPGIGEELNTPVINYSRPDFNLYTNPRSTESLKEQSTGSMLNNNNPTTININNSTANQSSIINAVDVWCSDKLDLADYPSLLFSPDSTKSSNSPSGLNSSDLTEESFIYETTTCDTINLPVKYSHDYEDFAFVDEIDQITKLKEFNTDDYQSKFKIEDDDDDDDITFKFVANNLETKTVLYHDTMITGLEPPTMLLDDDSYLVTVKNFDDLIIKPDNNNKIVDSNVSNTNVDSGNSQVMVCEENLSDYILTPAPSPKSPANPVNHTSDIDDCEYSSDCYPVNEMNQASSPAEDRLHLEHNYNLNNYYNNRIDEKTTTTNSCKRKLVTGGSSTRQQEKRTRRALKLKIPALRQESVKIVVNTPDIFENILSMEDEKFDLIKFIDSSQEKNLIESPLPPTPTPTLATETATTTLPTKRPTPLDLEAIINEQCHTPAKRRRMNSYDNPGSVQSMTSTIHSDDSSTHPAPKRRGRPPKTESVLPSPSQYKHLSDADWKYLEMRNKNNEASRRSRINRKDREHLIESEARELEKEYRELADEEKTLLKQVAKWRQAVMKLAQI